jgi:hypothetical protein
MADLMLIKVPSVTRYSVFVEDDGRAAYAYLMDGDQIVADVWLYNRGPAPTEPEWKQGRPPGPMMNPVAYSKAEEVAPLSRESEVSVSWSVTPAGELEDARVFLHGALWAVLRLGSKPGWSRLAAKDGPLAKVLLNA